MNIDDDASFATVAIPDVTSFRWLLLWSCLVHNDDDFGDGASQGTNEDSESRRRRAREIGSGGRRSFLEGNGKQIRGDDYY